MRAPLLVVLAVAVALLAAGAATAHRLNEGLTTVGVNPRTGELEVVHRLYAHDLYPALGLDAEGEAALYSGRELLRLGIWAAGQFDLRRVGGGRVPLAFVGAEEDGEYVFLYFTGAAPAPGTEMVVDNRLLVSAWPAQSNLTNVRTAEGVASLTQGPSDRRPGTVRF